MYHRHLMRSQVKIRKAHLDSSQTSARDHENRANRQARRERGEGSRRYISYMPKARERRRSGGKGEFSPLPRRRKAWFVPLLHLCLPFLTCTYSLDSLARQSALLYAYARMCISIYEYARMYIHWLSWRSEQYLQYNTIYFVPMWQTYIVFKFNV